VKRSWKSRPAELLIPDATGVFSGQPEQNRKVDAVISVSIDTNSNSRCRRDHIIVCFYDVRLAA
jgi:hypothetical protein